MRILKNKFPLFLVAAITALLLFSWVLNRYSKQSGAATVTMSPKTVSVQPGGQSEITIQLAANPGAKLSGFDIALKATGAVSMQSVAAPINANGEPATPQMLTSTVNAKEAHLSYIYLNADADLPAAVHLKVTITGDANGSGTIELDPTASQLVGTIAGNVFQLNTIENAQVTVGTGGGIGNRPGETVVVQFDPSTVSAAGGTPFTSVLKIKPATDFAIRGFDSTVSFNTTEVEVTDISYQSPLVVSAGQGDDTTTLAQVNQRGAINLKAEVQAPTGMTLSAANFTAVVSLTFRSKTAGGFTVSAQPATTKAYKINQDQSITAVLMSGIAEIYGNGAAPAATPTPTTPGGGGGNTVSVHMDPASGTFGVGQAFNAAVLIDGQAAGQKVTAFDVKLKADNILTINSISDPIDKSTGGDTAKFTMLKKEFNAATGDIFISYVILRPDAELPTYPQITISFTGTTAGTANVSVVSAQVTGNIAANSYTVSTSNGTYTIGQGGGGNPTPTPTTGGGGGNPTATPAQTVTPKPTGSGGGHDDDDDDDHNVSDNRCKEIKNKIKDKRKDLQEKKKRYLAVYKNFNNRINEMEARMRKAKKNSSRLKSYISKLNDLVDRFDKDLDEYIKDLQKSDDIKCNTKSFQKFSDEMRKDMNRVKEDIDEINKLYHRFIKSEVYKNLKKGK